MANVILTLTDSAGASWSSELPWETYALLLAASQRSAGSHQEETPEQTDSELTPSDVAVEALERAIFRHIDEGEGMPASLLEDALRLLEIVRTQAPMSRKLQADIDTILTQRRATGITMPATKRLDPESWSRWHVRGVVSYTLSNGPLDATMVVDTLVAALDWHAAENTALDQIRAALALPSNAQFTYTWAEGPMVTHIQTIE